MIFEMDLADVKPYANLLSVIGPAIIFFSWIMSNTLQQRYQAAKSSVERAQSERRLYGELTEARQWIEGLARELNKVRTEFNELRRARAAEANKPRELQECDRDSVELGVVSTAIGARQIDWGARFCSNEVDLSRVLAARSGTAHTLKATSIEFTQLRKAKDELLRQMSRLLGSSRTIDGETEKQIHRLERTYSEEMLPRFAPLLHTAVEASNILQGEVATQLARVKRRADVMSWIAFAAYIVGTALVVLGSVLDKLVPSAPDTLSSLLSGAT